MTQEQRLPRGCQFAAQHMYQQAYATTAHNQQGSQGMVGIGGGLAVREGWQLRGFGSGGSVPA